MQRNVLLLLLVFLHFFSAAQQRKIACIGNGMAPGIADAAGKKGGYSAPLQQLLGRQYSVIDFAVPGATVLKKGNHAYRQTKACAAALASRPDIVFINLGSDDALAVNRSFYNEFVSDYKDLVNSFLNLPKPPRIILLLPVVSFTKDTAGVYDPILVKHILPMIRQVAFDTKLEVIDLHPLFLEKPALMPDGVHPSPAGSRLMAERLYEVVQFDTSLRFDIFDRIKEEKKITSFHGYDCADFLYAGRNCKVVKPRVPVAGYPWIWRARFWGHEPQTDIALLERGFHVVYCDVAELFGNTVAVNAWNEFYALMQSCGLNKKLALEGMSRGGVYIYNWALANPGKVACIYADAPVLDLKSWPGGKGSGPGSKADWEIFKKDYQLNEQQAAAFKDNPLDNAGKIGTLGFPMLHVVGDADEVVPVAENTAPFEQGVKTAGGTITVIHKPGVKHHPHSLADPTPIVNFVLRATGYTIQIP